MLRILLLTLCSVLTATPIFAQASGEHPADAVFARIGSSVDLEEKVYFGLFTRLRTDQFREATLTALPDGGLRMEIQTTDGSQVLELTRQQAEALAQYVSRYEALRFNPVPPELVEAQQVMALDLLARPTLAFADTRQVTVRLRDGGRAQGWVLYADEQYLVLHTSDTPFDATAFEANVVAIPGSQIEHVDLPGLPAFALRAAEVVGVAAIQAGLAYATYDSNPSTAFGVNAVIAPATGAGLYLLERSRLQSPYEVNGNRASYLSLLRRIRPRVFFSKDVAPELRAWLAARPVVATADFRNQHKPLRHFMHFMVSNPFSAAPDGVFERMATANLGTPPSGVRRTFQGDKAGFRNVALGAEVTVSPIRLLHLGAEGHRYYSLEDANVTRETITRRTGWAVFGGVTLGDGTGRTGHSKVSISGGVANREARLDGFIFATLAVENQPGSSRVTQERYWVEESNLLPYGRLMYDFFVTPVTSLSIKLTYVPEPPLKVEEKVLQYRYQTYLYEITQEAHAYTFNPLSISLGLRTHL